jgi:hypothetical protein
VHGDIGTDEGHGVEHRHPLGAAKDGDVEHSQAVAGLHSAIVEERGQPFGHCGEIFEATALHLDATSRQEVRWPSAVPPWAAGRSGGGELQPETLPLVDAVMSPSTLFSPVSRTPTAITVA